ncbi:MAG: hypothetical protein K6A32_09725 [Bacteroidales bacterium]|nr:hypothetical protein [Bacteroidales bacterium]
MKIKNVKVTMSRIGITSLKEPRKVVYMPLAKIDYMEKECSSQTVNLDQAFLPDKKYFKGWIIGLSYFVGITKDSYQIYDENGIRTGTASIEKYGQPIQVNEDDFVCLKGKTASWINRNGECDCSRELTDDDYRNVAE